MTLKNIELILDIVALFIKSDSFFKKYRYLQDTFSLYVVKNNKCGHFFSCKLFLQVKMKCSMFLIVSFLRISENKYHKPV